MLPFTDSVSDDSPSEMIILSIMSEFGDSNNHYLVEIQMNKDRKRNRFLFCRDMRHDLTEMPTKLIKPKLKDIVLKQISQLYKNNNQFNKSDAELVSEKIVETFKKNKSVALKTNTNLEDPPGTFRDQLTAEFVAFMRDGVPGIKIFHRGWWATDVTFVSMDHGAAASSIAPIQEGALKTVCGKYDKNTNSKAHILTPFDCSTQRVVHKDAKQISDQGVSMKFDQTDEKNFPPIGSWDNRKKTGEPDDWRCTFKYEGGGPLSFERLNNGFETVLVSTYFGNTKYTYIVQSFAATTQKIITRTLLLKNDEPLGFIIGDGEMSLLYKYIVPNSVNETTGMVNLILYTPWVPGAWSVFNVHIGVVQGRKSLGDLIANCIVSLL